MRYAVFLRGVNLGRSRRIGMADLRSAATDAGYGRVGTYLQSGNLVLETDQSAAEVGAGVGHLIRDTFGMDVAVVVRGEPELSMVIEANPFAAEATADPTRVHAMFLDPMPPPEVWGGVDANGFLPDRFQSDEGVVYLHLPDGMARTALPGALEGLLGDATVTTRNWRTVERVAQLMRPSDDQAT